MLVEVEVGLLVAVRVGVWDGVSVRQLDAEGVGVTVGVFAEVKVMVGENVEVGVRPLKSQVVGS